MVKEKGATRNPDQIRRTDPTETEWLRTRGDCGKRGMVDEVPAGRIAEHEGDAKRVAASRDRGPQENEGGSVQKKGVRPPKVLKEPIEG